MSKFGWGARKSGISRDDTEYNVGTSDVQTFPFFLTTIQATFAHPHASHRSLSIKPQCHKYHGAISTSRCLRKTSGPPSFSFCPVRLDAQRPRQAPPYCLAHLKPSPDSARLRHCSMRRFWGYGDPVSAVMSSMQRINAPMFARLRCPALLCRLEPIPRRPRPQWRTRPRQSTWVSIQAA
jgi:hypothetical protein